MQYAQKTDLVFVYNAKNYEIHKNPLQSVKMCAILYTVDEMSDSTDGSAVSVYKLSQPTVKTAQANIGTHSDRPPRTG